MCRSRSRRRGEGRGSWAMHRWPGDECYAGWGRAGQGFEWEARVGPMLPCWRCGSESGACRSTEGGCAVSASMPPVSHYRAEHGKAGMVGQKTPDRRRTPGVRGAPGRNGLVTASLRKQACAWCVKARPSAFRGAQPFFSKPASPANGECVAALPGCLAETLPCVASSWRWCSLSWQYRHRSSQLLPSGGLLS